MRPVLAVLLATVLAATGIVVWRLERPNGDGPVWQGYVEGEYVYVAAPVAGRLDRLAVSRGGDVAVDAPLFALESGYETAALTAARRDADAARATLEDMLSGKRPPEIQVTRAQLEQARAEALDAKAQYERHGELLKTEAVTQAQFDNYRALFDASRWRVAQLEAQLAVDRLPDREARIAAQRAQVEAAEARRDEAAWTLAHKTIAATRAGLVVDTLFRPGEWIVAGQSVVQILPPENVKVRFYVPEAALASVALGQRVLAVRDGAANVEARVTFVAPEAEYTPPIIYSNETRVKLVFRIEAHPVRTEDARALHPGQPVAVRPWSAEAARP